MDENTTQNPPPHGGWWFAWIGSILIASFSGVRVLFGSELSAVVFLVGIVLHLVSSMKLSRNVKGCWLPAMLYFGGWLLMVVMASLGCAMNAPY